MSALRVNQNFLGKKHLVFERVDSSLIDTSGPTKISYVVLGFFFVTNVWQEIVQPDEIDKSYTVSKLMLQRVNTDKTPVYLKDVSMSAPLVDHDTHLLEAE